MNGLVRRCGALEMLIIIIITRTLHRSRNRRGRYRGRRFDAGLVPAKTIAAAHGSSGSEGSRCDRDVMF